MFAWTWLRYKIVLTSQCWCFLHVLTLFYKKRIQRYQRDRQKLQSQKTYKIMAVNKMKWKINIIHTTLHWNYFRFYICMLCQSHWNIIENYYRDEAQSLTYNLMENSLEDLFVQNCCAHCNQTLVGYSLGGTPSKLCPSSISDNLDGFLSLTVDSWEFF